MKSFVSNVAGASGKLRGFGQLSKSRMVPGHLHVTQLFIDARRDGPEKTMDANSKPREEYLTVNRNRYGVYTFLSRVYSKELTSELIQEFASAKSPLLHIGDLEELEEGELKRGFQTLREYLQNVTERNIEEVKLELAVEYADLFLGVAGKPPHPSESVYASKEHLVMGKARDEVLSAYRKAGLDRVKEFTEPEDHIAIELNFMALLCQRTMDALERNEKNKTKEYLRTQKDFIETHLAKWVPQLTKDILAQSEVEFYKGIAMITDGFIEMEKKTIEELSAGIDDLGTTGHETLP